MTTGYSYSARAPNLVAYVLGAGTQAQRHTHTHRWGALSVGCVGDRPVGSSSLFKRGAGMFSHVKHTKQKNASIKFTHNSVHLEKVPNKKNKRKKKEKEKEKHHYQFFLPI